MALFGGSSSKTKVTQTTNNTTFNQSLEDVSAPVLAGVEGDVSINILDGGAVLGALDATRDLIDTSQFVAEASFDAASGNLNRSLDFGESVVDSIENAFSDSLSFAEDIVTKTGAQLAQTTSTVLSASRSDSAATLETFIKYGAGMMAVFFLAQVLRKKG